MTCCCCGAYCKKMKQHWNRDTGYSICGECVVWQKSLGTTDAEIKDLYGLPYINWEPVSVEVD